MKGENYWGYFVKKRLYDRKRFVLYFFLLSSYIPGFVVRCVEKRKEVITRTHRLLALVSFPLAVVRVDACLVMSLTRRTTCCIGQVRFECYFLSFLLCGLEHFQ